MKATLTPREFRGEGNPTHSLQRGPAAIETSQSSEVQFYGHTVEQAICLSPRFHAEERIYLSGILAQWAHSRRRSHGGDARFITRSSIAPSTIPGCIEHIYRYQGTAYLAIQCCQNVDHGTIDSFPQCPCIPAKLHPLSLTRQVSDKTRSLSSSHVSY